MEELETSCPSCSPESSVIHKVLKSQRGDRGKDIYIEATVKCLNCGTIHKTQLRIPKPVNVDAVVSFGEKSVKKTFQLFPDQSITVGEIIEGVEITKIEKKNKSVKEAEIGEIDTFWGKNISKVDVPFTLHLEEKTRSKKIEMDGLEQIEVGDTLRIEGILFKIKKIVSKKGKVKISLAKDVKRAFATRGRK